jgi:hypothetical protein
VPWSPFSLRRYADAFLVATIAALVVDAAMHLATAAIRLTAHGGGAPWWVTANLIERGRWVGFALILRALEPHLTRNGSLPSPAGTPPADAWRQVAIAVVAVPLAWIAATWIVSAIRFTLLGSWDTDGRVFLSFGYYRGLATDLVPWAMAAAALMAVRRHLWS